MPKSSLELVRERVARKRQRAREAGLCYVCCKQKPNPGRTVCVPCRAIKVERERHKRQKVRQVAKFSAIATHERAGDVARDHHFHDGAAQHYQDALAVREISEADRSRLSEKLAHALFYGEKPGTAIPWLERALPRYLDSPEKAAKAVEILLQASRQLLLDSKIEEALPVIERAINIANASDNPRLQKLANARMLSPLLTLGRYSEAEKYVAVVETITADDDPIVRLHGYMQRALFTVRRGEASQAYEYFERAIQAAKECEDNYTITVIWFNYAKWATNLGDIELGKTCSERALLVARQNQIAWRVAYLCLDYANLLAKLGQYEVAYGFLLEALSHDTRAQFMENMLAEIGIPIALHMNDEAILVKCARESVIERVLQSGVPMALGPVAAAFAALYAQQGRRRKAQIILHRALEKVNRVDGVWDLPLEVARHGELADIPRARSLLEARMLLPACSVAEAILKLFDALVAQRNGHVTIMHNEAIAATELFEKLHWYAYADTARTLLPVAARPLHLSVRHDRPFLNMEMLTQREQQVAELVIKGLTNRAIAERLSIKERTVEAHMTSIMSHLGMRSRYQLVGAISDAES